MFHFGSIAALRPFDVVMDFDVESHMVEQRLSDEDLFRKYEGGRMPPLASSSDGRWGLVNDKLLEIYQRGFCDVHNTSLGVLLVGEAQTNTNDDKWRTGNYVYNKAAKYDWAQLCRLIREFRANTKKKPGNTQCERCDRMHAWLAESKGRAVAYLCVHGMIDFAVPIRVGKQTVAVLFSGQLRPKHNVEWPPGLVQTDCQRKSDGSGSVDVLSLSQERIAHIADYGISKNEIQKSIEQDEEGRFKAVGPSEVKRVLKSLDVAAMHLSDLATRTYELERYRLASLIRFEFARTLISVKQDQPNWQENLSELCRPLQKLCSFIGLEFAALCRILKLGRVEVICQVGPSEILQQDTVLEFKPSAIPAWSGEKITSNIVVD